MDQKIWGPVAGIVLFIACSLGSYAIGIASRPDINVEALSKAEDSLDSLYKSLIEPSSPSQYNSALGNLNALEAELVELDAKTSKALSPSFRRLKRALQAPTNGSVRGYEMDLDHATDAAIAVRKVRSSFREYQIYSGAPPFISILGRDIRAAISRLSISGAVTLAATLIVAYAVFTTRGRGHVKSFIATLGTLKVGNVELTFRASGREATVAQINGLSKEVNASLLGLSSGQMLSEKLSAILTNPDVEKALGKPCSSIKDFRAVIQMPDPLFSQTIFQATSYWPQMLDTTTRPGRRRSIHFGAIGRCWKRHQRKSISGNVDQNLVSGLQSSVNRREKSYAVICIPSDGSDAKAVIYMDSSDPYEFPTNVDQTEALATAIQTAARASGLAKAIESIYAEMNCAHPLISIHEDSDILLPH